MDEFEAYINQIISEYNQTGSKYASKDILPPEKPIEKQSVCCELEGLSGASTIVRDNGRAGIKIIPDAIPFRKPVDSPCEACGSFDLWQSKYGIIICSVCHPPVRESDVLRRWNTRGALEKAA